MANVSHSSLTGADLHEPKGAATAPANQIYVSNGSGSGVWTDVNSAISNTAWVTGDTKTSFAAAASTGWILFAEGGTIGDASSGASIRANADTSALFQLFWNTFSNTVCPVSTGRGTSASADYAAHKTIQVPPMASRALGIAGSGTGLTSRTLGTTVGAETYTLLRSDLPNVQPTFTGTASGQSFIASLNSATVANGASTAINPIFSGNAVATSAPAGTVQSLNGGVTQTAFTQMQPTVFLNLFIKL